VDQAFEVWKKLLPTNPGHPPSVSRQEPFSMTNTYRGPDAGASAGRSLFSWRTGTAGWAYRNAIEAVMGVRAEHDGLAVRGTLPREWNHARMTRRYRGMNITIEWQPGERSQLTINGKACDGMVAPLDLIRDGAKIVCEFVQL
jgi:cellobiose phosphorylase